MRRPRYAPEVVQTSGMDCGPAVLASLSQGLGIQASYPRLRDACHTSVDGTSIDDLESVACDLGLEVAQVMMPEEQVSLAESDSFPAIVVTQLPGGFTHFVLAWRRHGSKIQIMDPAVGRRWLGVQEFQDSLYVHSQVMAASVWHEWAASESSLSIMRLRLRKLGIGREADRFIQHAVDDNGWFAIARLDAATRMAESLCRGGVRRGAEICGVLRSLLIESQTVPTIPASFWSVQWTRNSDPNSDETLVSVRGAVMIRCTGRLDNVSRPDLSATSGNPTPQAHNLLEPAPRPWRDIWGYVPGLRLISAVVLVAAVSLGAIATIFEAIMFRAVLNAGHELALPEQRATAAGVFLLFFLSLLFIEKAIAARLFGLGRTLECQLRLAFQQKIPRLSGDYLSTRPTSDTAERLHAIHEIRSLPLMVGETLRTVVTLAITALAIAWIDTEHGQIAILAAVLATLIPVFAMKKIREIDLRVRTHSGALSLYYYDALLGLSTIRAHRADRAIRREHEALLAEWANSSRQLVLASVTAEGIQLAVGYGLAAWLMLLHAGPLAQTGSALLMAYWALNLPTLGEQVVALMRQVPTHRNVAMRILEPLSSPEETQAEPNVVSPRCCEPELKIKGVHVSFSDVTVRVAGREILRDATIDIPAGCHVGIVGTSGAGKSTLLGLLLGWHSPIQGNVKVDDKPLDPQELRNLRSEIAWVDPSTQLWNRSLVENLSYASSRDNPERVGDILHPTDMMSVLARLPQGLQTLLGEGGCLLSGGEGQRVRFARSALQESTRLAILDEPFRGLDRGTRRRLLQAAREMWSEATLLCVTHDVSETERFDRVLVIEDGVAVEYGDPIELLANQTSRYRQMLLAEKRVHSRLWNSNRWRKIVLREGRLETSLARQTTSPDNSHEQSGIDQIQSSETDDYDRSYDGPTSKVVS